jgi:hypothetical protein
MDEIHKIKSILQDESRSIEIQWQLIENILSKMRNRKTDVLHWIFVEHKGYTDIRAKAGIEYLIIAPEKGWTILESLISSKDPDDRDVAIVVLQNLDDPKAKELAKVILYDVWPYLQFEAIEFLMDTFPIEAKIVLANLCNNEQEWVRKEAYRILQEIE